MKQSTNLFIAAMCLLMLAIFIESSAYPDLAKFLRLFTAAAGVIVLCLSGRAERLEDKEEQRQEERAQRRVELGEHNYSPDFAYINRLLILNRVNNLIDNEKEQPPCN